MKKTTLRRIANLIINSQPEEVGCLTVRWVKKMKNVIRPKGLRVGKVLVCGDGYKAKVMSVAYDESGLTVNVLTPYQEQTK